jgi:hypothetical protein
MEDSKKELTPREKSNSNLKAGRPKGAKNKTTLFKEAMKEGFENLLETEGKKVFEAVVSKAKDGDMTAAKLILDRIIPVADVTGVAGKGNTQVVINVEGMGTNITLADQGVEPDYIDVQAEVFTEGSEVEQE